MESATWVGPNVLQTSSRLGLRSEASTRFEKQLHPDGALAAQRAAAKLMVELCGARLVPGTIDVHPGAERPLVLTLRLERIRRLLGITVPVAEVREILGRLGFAVAEFFGAGSDSASAVLEVTVPWFRDADVRREADLIEEIARIHGLEQLPATLPARRRAVGRLRPDQRLRRRLEDALRDRGLAETVSWSFTSPSALARVGVPLEDVLTVSNPLSEDGSLMRPLLLPGLLDAAARNATRGRPNVALFESAHVYRPDQDAPAAPEGSPRGALPAHERHHLGALLTELAPGGWRTPPRPADFFAARALVEAVLEPSGIAPRVTAAEWPFLHPGRSAAVWAGEVALGWVGELHPRVVRDAGLPSAAAFELDLELVAELATGPVRYEAVTEFPSVRQDLAVVVPEAASAEIVVAAVRAGGGELLHEVRLFDVYRGDQVGEGRKSLALALAFRARERTLTDEEVADRRTAIAEQLEAVGGSLRG